jgi:hypothetical protein
MSLCIKGLEEIKEVNDILLRRWKIGMVRKEKYFWARFGNLIEIQN